jgi:hypothetical protein
MKLQKIRNCITHNEGLVDANNAPFLRGVNLSVQEGHRIKLPTDYFQESLKLIGDTCELIIDKCREARKKEG